MSFAFIPSPNINNPLPPRPPTPKHLISTIWSSRQFITREWFRTLYKFVHEVRTITICFYACDIIFVSDDTGICAKIPRELNYESNKIQILGENWINAKLKHRKAHNLDFIREIWWPVRETGRSVMYPGELVCMQLIAVLSGPLCFSWSAANLTMSVFSCEYGHTLSNYMLNCQTPRAGKSIENWEKVMRFPKFPRRESPVN